MGIRAYLTALGALLLFGCGLSAAANNQSNAAESAPTPPAAGPAGAAVRYEPWEIASCGMLLKDSADGAHVAWVAAYEDYGTHLETHVEAIEMLPHATDLGLRLRADGDPRREIAARGQRGHDDSDSANLLSIILDEPQRRFVDGAKRIAVMRGETMLIELPVDTLPDVEPIAAKCSAGGPGDYVNE